MVGWWWRGWGFVARAVRWWSAEERLFGLSMGIVGSVVVRDLEERWRVGICGVEEWCCPSGFVCVWVRLRFEVVVWVVMLKKEGAQTAKPRPRTPTAFC